MTVASVFDQLERLLPRVSKPIQYVGGELGAVVKDWDAATVRWALMYPDAYEVGLPNQGVQILYEVLNEQPDVLAERTYAVWPDLEALMREHGVPQFTVDAHRPVRAFDLFGISFATELGLHEHAHRARPGRHPAGRPGPDRRRPDRGRRRARRVQPGADRRLHRRRRARRRRGGGRGDHRDRAGPGRPRAPGRPRRAAAAPGPDRGRSMCRASTTSTTCPTAGSSGSCRTGPTCRSGSTSGPPWTWTSGRTRASRWCRWPRRCTSATRSRSSAAVPGAAASARPG